MNCFVSIRDGILGAITYYWGIARVEESSEPVGSDSFCSPQAVLVKYTWLKNRILGDL